MNKQPESRAPGRSTLKLEVVVIPVSDVDRAKRFYEGLGWRLDADFSNGDGLAGGADDTSRLTVLDPLRQGITTAAPGSVQGLLLIVSDIEAARAELVGHGVDVSEVFHFEGSHRDHACRGRTRKVAPTLMGLVQRSGRQRLAAPGDQDAASRTRTQPGRRDPDRASARDRAAPWPVRSDRSEAPLVGVVRRLHRRARARQDSRGGSQRCRAPHGRCPPMRGDIVPGRPALPLRLPSFYTRDSTNVFEVCSEERRHGHRTLRQPLHRRET